MKNNIIDCARAESSPTEPCTLAEAKAQAIVTYTDDDTLITSFIKMARKAVENYCNISIVVQSVTLIADLYNDYELPYGPVTGITGVQTMSGQAGSGPVAYETATQQWQTDGTQFLTFMPRGATAFNPNQPFTGYFQWGPYASPYGQVPYSRWKITYTTGYSPVPDDLKQAVLAQVVYLYENRGDENKVLANNLCTLAKALSDPYKRLAWQ